MKTLSGREASLLALLAQSEGSDASEKELQEIVSSLEGDARDIAEAILDFTGKKKKHTEDVLRAAEGFRSWVASMRRHHKPK